MTIPAGWYWNVWCYRCQAREAGETSTEQQAVERIDRFKDQHRSSCGAGASFGSAKGVIGETP